MEQGEANYQWKSNQSFAYAISLLCSLCFFSLILRNLTPTQSAGVHVEKPYVCSIVSLYVCVRHSSDDLENCSVQYPDYPQRLKEMKIIAHPTRACGVNIATSFSVQRVVHSSCELCMRGRYGKRTQGSTQNHRMDACLRSKLLRGGVGKSQKTCGESKFHDEKGKANKESGCRRRTGPKVGRTGQRVVPVWCLCRGLIGARWRDVRRGCLRRGARRGGLR